MRREPIVGIAEILKALCQHRLVFFAEGGARDGAKRRFDAPGLLFGNDPQSGSPKNEHPVARADRIEQREIRLMHDARALGLPPESRFRFEDGNNFFRHGNAHYRPPCGKKRTSPVRQASSSEGRSDS